jgi:membrane-bound metal-dependent hydrolase YbcI (DUF457 family)
MFVGHFGVALAAKRVAPRTSLGTLMLAAGFVDVLWPAFLLLGWEHVRIDPGNTAVTPLDFYDYPFSHSLLAAAGWALAFGAAYFAATRYVVGAAVTAALVLSHWLLDFVTHRPDLPLWPPEGPKVGLGLWNSLPATFAVELALFGVGAWLYASFARPLDRTGHFAYSSLVAVLLAIYFANVLGPPPPSTQSIGLVGLASLLLFAWPYWIDRHRAPRGAVTGALAR